MLPLGFVARRGIAETQFFTPIASVFHGLELLSLRGSMCLTKPYDWKPVEGAHHVVNGRKRRDLRCLGNDWFQRRHDAD